MNNEEWGLHFRPAGRLEFNWRRITDEANWTGEDDARTKKGRMLTEFRTYLFEQKSVPPNHFSVGNQYPQAVNFPAVYIPCFTQSVYSGDRWPHPSETCSLSW